MLFNSFPFAFVFLPITFALYFGAAAIRPRTAVPVLFLASLIFYSYFDVRLLPLLMISIAINYALSLAIAGRLASARSLARLLLIGGLVFNLGLIAYFKYMNWFVEVVDSLVSDLLPATHIILPLGISFYTFTQIAYLVDTYQGKVRERNLSNYILFVTYFPHLIAGPVLHHSEMMTQFADPSNKRPALGNVSAGLLLFLIGVIKKICLADTVAPMATAVFDGHGSLGFAEAWLGTLAYTLQIYFDFSGYTDMALGLSRMFNVTLPLNFDSPYKSLSPSEFWRRWHMTLSRFLRDYLYIPLGGNRHGEARRYLNLMLTMVLGGLWHGAGWTFLIWGALHGGYLMIDHGIRRLAGTFGVVWRPWMRLIAQPATLLAVILAWVFFRAASLDAALRVLSAMVDPYATGPAKAAAEYPAGVLGLLDQATWGWIIALAAVALLAPNSQTIIGSAEAAIAAIGRPERRFLRLAASGFAMVAVCFAISLTSLRHGVSPFIYFNF